MSLGAGPLRIDGAAQSCSKKREVSMATLQTATTRHHHPESLSGILTTNTQLGRRKYQEGVAHRKKFSMATGGKLNMTLQVTAGKQTAFLWIMKCPCWKSGATPSHTTKKLLTSIVYILTLPKFHLATCNELSHFACQVHFLLVLVNGFVRGQHYLSGSQEPNMQVNFKGYLPSKKVDLFWTTRQDFLTEYAFYDLIKIIILTFLSLALSHTASKS